MSVYFHSAEFDLARIGGIEKRIRTAIPDLIRIRAVDEIARKNLNRPHDPDYLLIVSFGNDVDLVSQLADAASGHDGLFLILISDEISATDYKRLARTGAVDWVSAKAVPHEILDIMSRRRSDAAPRSDRQLPVIASFVPSAGGVGNTTLAVQVATFVNTDKATAGRNICIVDLDFQTSHVCDHLDIEPRLQIQEISNNPERLDEQLFEIYVSRHACGLHVFAAPRSKFSICQLNLSAIDALFDIMATRYDLIIIDCPATWFDWTPRIVAGSDGLIVTGLNTIPGLRQSVETVAAVRGSRNPLAPMAVALNRCERGLIGGIARRHHVEKVLGEEKVFYVREQPMVLESINTGMPLALSRGAGKALAEIEPIARFCAELKSVRTAAPRAARDNRSPG
jgi:pilus assembly protein CpaE